MFAISTAHDHSIALKPHPSDHFMKLQCALPTAASNSVWYNVGCARLTTQYLTSYDTVEMCNYTRLHMILTSLQFQD